MGVCCVWLPGCVSVCKDGSNELFVYCGDVFLGVTERCICECSEDIQAGLGFSVNVVCVLPECHTPIVSHSKDSGGVSLRDRCVVQRNPGAVLYSCAQGVIRVSVDLFVETLSLFVSSHCSSVWMYCWSLFFVGRCLLLVVVCRWSLFFVGHCLSLVVVCRWSL